MHRAADEYPWTADERGRRDNLRVKFCGVWRHGKRESFQCVASFAGFTTWIQRILPRCDAVHCTLDIHIYVDSKDYVPCVSDAVSRRALYPVLWITFIRDCIPGER